MRKAFSLLFILGLMGFLGVNTTTSSAQCAVVGTDETGQRVTVQISCSFPILTDTGDQEADLQAYEAAKNAWKASSPQDYETIITLSGVYFEISQAVFNTMPAARKAAIQADPALYHIVE